MRNSVLSLAVLSAWAISLLHATPAQALNQKSWVSSTGSGTTCSRAAPCATFQVAHDNTAPGGEIGVVDSGDFGKVTISKAISIVAEGVDAGILVTSGNTALFVEAGPNDVVHLRGLVIDGGGAAGGFGIFFTGGAALQIENCVIKNFNASGPSTGFGISFLPAFTSPAELYVSNTTIAHNGNSGDGGGILIAPQANAPVRVVLNRVEANNNFRGIKADGGLNGSQPSIMNINIRDSVVSASTNNGIVATTPSGGGTILMTIDHVTSADNGNGPPTVGVVSDGPSSFIRLNNSVVTGNWTGLSFTNGATLESYGNNVVRGNAVNGSPSVVSGLN